MNGAPKISVIIAAYNRAEFLAETIDSVLQQQFRELEVIVVNDGSTDRTEQVLRAYGDRIRVVTQDNRGPSAARNAGVAHARAPWLAFQDSDDLYARHHCATLYEHAWRRPDCGMVFANGAYLEGPEHNRTTIIPPAKSRRLARAGLRLIDLFDKSIVRLQAALISKSAYEALGGHDHGLRIAMDLDLAFRIFARYPVVYIDSVVFYYRKHPGNIVLNHELRLIENIKVVEKLVREFPEAEALLGPDRVARRLAYRYYRLAKCRWNQGRKYEAREALREAVALMPFVLKYRLCQLRWTHG
jgi:glycosyltransferase involved in cell wall biosynthesis